MEQQGAKPPGIMKLTTSLSVPFTRLDKYSSLLKELERHTDVSGVGWGAFAIGDFWVIHKHSALKDWYIKAVNLFSCSYSDVTLLLCCRRAMWIEETLSVPSVYTGIYP